MKRPMRKVTEPMLDVPFSQPLIFINFVRDVLTNLACPETHSHNEHIEKPITNNNISSILKRDDPSMKGKTPATIAPPPAPNDDMMCASIPYISFGAVDMDQTKAMRNPSWKTQTVLAISFCREGLSSAFSPEEARSWWLYRVR